EDLARDRNLLRRLEDRVGRPGAGQATRAAVVDELLRGIDRRGRVRALVLLRDADRVLRVHLADRDSDLRQREGGGFLTRGAQVPGDPAERQGVADNQVQLLRARPVAT